MWNNNDEIGTQSIHGKVPQDFHDRILSTIRVIVQFILFRELGRILEKIAVDYNTQIYKV